MKYKQLILCGIAIVVVGVASFFGGMQYQKRQRNTMFIQGRGGARQAVPMGQSFRPAAGEVSSIDDKSITIKLMDNSSKIIILSEKTIFNKTTEGNKADIKSGDKISVFGTTNSDGSITANTISIGGVSIPTK